MIGIYDYTVVLTFMSLISAMVGMTHAMQGHFRWAIVLLAFSGLMDTFDGKVARTKKNRTEDEKLYGIQLDSLADVVAFGAFPIMICFLMGMQSTIDMLILCLYGSCGVIRLAYFNVLETNRQMNPTGEEKVYHGLPITSIAVILPMTALLSFVIPQFIFLMVLRLVILATAIAFIVDFKFHKPSNTVLALIIVIVGCSALATLFFSRYKIHHPSTPENPLMEEFDEMMDELEDETLTDASNE